MISRLTSTALLFAVVTGTSMAFAASAQQMQIRRADTPAVKTVQLERVVITGKRIAAE